MRHSVTMNGPSDLERRASAGDAEAQFALAAGLLALADSPDSFARGMALVEEATEKGHAEAACMLATLEAVGAGRRQDWTRAFECLELAADRGSEHARAQLRLLSGISGPPGEAGHWRAPRTRIELDRMLRVPERMALSDRPRLRVLQGFASPAECQWVVARLRPRLAPAMVWDPVSGSGRVDPVRSNSAVELRLPDMDVVTEMLRARISVATRLPEPIFEVPQVMHYSVGQEFKPHHDFLDPQQEGHAADLARRGQRVGTFLVYLNDDFEGGETEFPKAGLSYRGRTGDALFLANVTPDGRPDPLTLHAGRPPTRGEKWVFSQWIRDRPPSAPAR
jgi:prolyl 4-hydroxylase